jgi:membrane protein DedA with SNARE-associated domain
LPFVAFLTWLGVRVGANWRAIEQNFKWLDYAVVAALAVLVVWAIARRLTRKRTA